jgi:hypothetical protein
MRPMLLAVLVAAFAICASNESHAALVQWTLNNVRFSDGGTASGFFNVDTTTGDLAITLPPEGSLEGGGFSITTTPGTILSGGRAVPFFYGSGESDWGVDAHSFRYSFGTISFAYELVLNADADLQHNTQGTFQVLPGPVDQCGAFDDRCSEESQFGGDLGFESLFRTVVGGTVTATVIPEPSIFVLFALAAGLLLIMRKRL